MAAVLNRTTKQFIPSANTPDFPVIDWIINPDLSAVGGFPSRYWIITGDIVTLMTPAQRAVVDLAISDAETLSNRAAAVAAVDTPADVSLALTDGIQLRELIELFNKRDNFLTTRIIEIQNALETLAAAGGGANSRIDGLPANYLPTNTRTRAEAITDYTDDINAGGADT